MRALVFALSVLAASLTLSPLPAGAAVDAACDEAAEWVDVPGQGLSCRVGNLWMLRMPDGTKLFTHGPDPVPADGGGGTITSSRPPFCVPDTEPHQRLAYVRPLDQLSHYAFRAPQIRSMAMQANGALYDEGQLFGAHREFRFLCDPDGQIHVDDILIPVPSSAISFETITKSMAIQGYKGNLTKYWAWYDRLGLEFTLPGGQGSVQPDDRLVLENANNNGGSYAVNYGYTGNTGAFIMFHEAGHTLGAVQNSAPNTSGAYHCNDGQDVMCYADGGPQSDYRGNVCAVQRFDCNHDDYFHPDPPAGNYLQLHWNIGSAYTRFIHHPGAVIQPPPPPPPPGDCEWAVHGGATHWTTINTGDTWFPHWGTDYILPTGCAGHTFRLASTSATADFDVCWLMGASEQGCNSNVGDESGTIPGWSDRARVWLRSGTMGQFDLVAPA